MRPNRFRNSFHVLELRPVREAKMNMGATGGPRRGRTGPARLRCALRNPHAQTRRCRGSKATASIRAFPPFKATHRLFAVLTQRNSFTNQRLTDESIERSDGSHFPSENIASAWFYLSQSHDAWHYFRNRPDQNEVTA